MKELNWNSFASEKQNLNMTDDYEVRVIYKRGSQHWIEEVYQILYHYAIFQ